jgi:iron complex transport system permease protein
VQYFSDMSQTMQTLRWLLGDLDVASYRPLVVALPMLGVSFVVFAALAPSLNLLSLGDDLAAARGVPVVRMERIAFLSASLATGAAVSISGPIGFVGIIVPHLVRCSSGPTIASWCPRRSVSARRFSSRAI